MLIQTINPSTSNKITGASLPNYDCNYSIKIDNATINCTITITRDKGNVSAFTVSSKTILSIKHSKLLSIVFSDSNSYNIFVMQAFNELPVDENGTVITFDEEIEFAE